MRIYYVMEAQGRRCHVRSALGVDGRAWNRRYRRVGEWLRQLEQRYGIPAAAQLRASDLLAAAAPTCGCGCHVEPASPHGAQAVAQGIRVVEELCRGDRRRRGHQRLLLDMDEAPAYRRVALDRLFNRINATAAREGGQALVIFGQEPDETVTRTYERLRNYKPGARARRGLRRRLAHSQPSHRPVGAFRSPETDCLLQVAGMTAYALLWREEPAAGVDSGAMFDAFAVLDHALNRRASRHDSKGVVRR